MTIPCFTLPRFAIPRFAGALAGLVALSSTTAFANGLSPADRKLRQLLIGATTSCEAPIVIFGTRAGTLGGEAGTCGQGIETLTLRGEAVHVYLAGEDQRAMMGSLACQSLYKYNNPGGVTTYNLPNPGSNSIKTADLCLTKGALELETEEVKEERSRRSILRDSTSSRQGNPGEIIRNFNLE